MWLTPPPTPKKEKTAHQKHTKWGGALNQKCPKVHFTLRDSSAAFCCSSFRFCWNGFTAKSQEVFCILDSVLVRWLTSHPTAAVRCVEDISLQGHFSTDASLLRSRGVCWSRVRVESLCVDLISSASCGVYKVVNSRGSALTLTYLTCSKLMKTKTPPRIWKLGWCCR